jgi:hypothetical protein
VHEDVLSPVPDDEPVAFAVAEPLHGTFDSLLMFFHSCFSPFPRVLKVRLRPKQASALTPRRAVQKKKAATDEPLLSETGKAVCTFCRMITQFMTPVK